jgi:nicotinate-nucleotide adenylyltransferase
MKEIGLSCGTFNPIHLWHLLAAQCARDEFGLDKVLFIPNGEPPHKKNGILDKELRWEMVVAATAGHQYFEPNRIELDRVGPSYTLDTLTALKAQYGEDCRLNLIIGIDNVEPIPRWYKADEIFKLVRLLIAPRLCVDQMQLAEVTKHLPAHAEFAFIQKAPSSSVSSTLIREWLQQGRSVEYLVPPAVNQILLSKKHYVAPAVPTPAPVAPASNPAPTTAQ